MIIEFDEFTITIAAKDRGESAMSKLIELAQLPVVAQTLQRLTDIVEAFAVAKMPPSENAVAITDADIEYFQRLANVVFHGDMEDAVDDSILKELQAAPQWAYVQTVANTFTIQQVLEMANNNKNIPPFNMILADLYGNESGEMLKKFEEFYDFVRSLKE